AFLHRLSEKHDLSDAVFLVDGYGYQTALSRLGLSGRLDYVERNLVEKWFHTLKMRVDRFHNSWVAVTEASASGSYNLRNTTTIKDRIKRSTDEHRSRRRLTRQCRRSHQSGKNI
ncbi:transposase, partial [Haloferax sp. BAB-2207]